MLLDDSREPHENARLQFRANVASTVSLLLPLAVGSDAEPLPQTPPSRALPAGRRLLSHSLWMPDRQLTDVRFYASAVQLMHDIASTQESLSSAFCRLSLAFSRLSLAFSRLSLAFSRLSSAFSRLSSVVYLKSSVLRQSLVFSLQSSAFTRPSQGQSEVRGKSIDH